MHAALTRAMSLPTQIFSLFKLLAYPTVPGTPHGDGIDDALELLFPPTSACPGDLNGDASVNVQDLLLLLGTFGLVC